MSTARLNKPGYTVQVIAPSGEPIGLVDLLEADAIADRHAKQVRLTTDLLQALKVARGGVPRVNTRTLEIIDAAIVAAEGDSRD